MIIIVMINYGDDYCEWWVIIPPPPHPSILWISTSVSYILIYLLYFFAIDNVDFQKETCQVKLLHMEF